MVNKSPKDRVVGPFPNGLSIAEKTRVTNHVLTGMILQVGYPPETNIAPENRPSQKEIHLRTIHFQVLC